MKKLNILSLNGGSSTLKFALYEKNGDLNPVLSGSINRIGLTGGEFSVKSLSGKEDSRKPMNSGNMSEAVDFLMGWLDDNNYLKSLAAVGHRIVHGMNHTKAELISKSLLDQLEQNKSYDPDHLSSEIELIKSFTSQYPELKQVACFDTAFHATMPRVATLLPIPRRFYTEGIHRYGFHGISYSYLMEKLAEEPGVNINGLIIMAHLGNGASMVAVRNGQSIDTSMGFTPAGGFPMSTRSGDIDPGVAYYIMKKDSLSADQFNVLINRQSGLIGISETSSDMQDLQKMEKSDSRAADAIDIFCYQVKKWVGSFTAALGGLDTLVFSGGIGENAVSVRSRICEGLQYLGIELDHERNESSKKIISLKNSRVTVYVIPTDEEFMIAKTVCRVLSI
jgi:acetate kinase